MSRFGIGASAKLVLGDRQDSTKSATKVITQGVNWLEWFTVLAPLARAARLEQADGLRRELGSFQANISAPDDGAAPNQGPDYLNVLAEGVRLAGVREH